MLLPHEYPIALNNDGSFSGSVPANTHLFKLGGTYGVSDSNTLYAVWESDYKVTSLYDISQETKACLKNPGREHAYNNAKVAVQGTVTAYINHMLFLQDFCYYEGQSGEPNPGVNGEYVGMKIFTGMTTIPTKFTAKGAYIRVCGTFVNNTVLSDCSFPLISSSENDAQVLIKPEDNVGVHALYSYQGTSNKVRDAAYRLETLFQPVQAISSATVEQWEQTDDGGILFHLAKNRLAVRVYDAKLYHQGADEYLGKRIHFSGINNVMTVADTLVPTVDVASADDIEVQQDSGPLIDAPTTINIWGHYSGDFGNAIRRMIESFKQIEPNVTVSYSSVGSLHDIGNQVKSSMASGDYPDIAFGYADGFAECVRDGLAIDLDPYINSASYGWSAEDKEDLYSGFFNGGASYGVSGTYSLPFATASEALYYNKTALIGLDLSAIDPSINGGSPLTEAYINNLTWEDLFGHLIPAIQAYDAAQDAEHKLLKGTRYEHRIFGYDSEDNLFITLAKQYGYGYTSFDEGGNPSIDFDNDGMKNLMKTFKRAYDGGGFFTKGTNNNEYTNYTFTDNSALFSVSSTNGAAYLSSDKFETGIAKLPHPANGKQASANQGISMAILDHGDDDRALASWLFYKYVTNTANNAEWSIASNCAPLRRSSYNTQEYQDYLATGTIQARTASFLASVSDDLYTAPSFNGSQQARDVVYRLTLNCLQNQDLNANIDSLFAEAKNEALRVLG